MARRCIVKGDLDKEGLRMIVARIMDADGRWNDAVIQRVPDAEADARIDQLVNDGQFERWPPTP